METILSTKCFQGTRPRGGLLNRLISLLLIWQQRAIEWRHLAGLEPHVLEDVGLSQADIADEIGKPFWRS